MPNLLLPANRADALLAGANLFFAAAQSFAGQTSRLTGTGTPVDRRPETYHPATPIAPAFAIWGPLFASELRYALRRRRGDRLTREIGWLSAATFAGNTAWDLQAELRGFEPRSQAIIMAAAAAAVAALLKVERGDYTEHERREIALPIGTLAGWLVAACAANAEASRIQTFGRPGAHREANEAVVLIAVATAATCAITIASRGHAHFAAGAAWGLAGIVARNVKEKRPRVALAASAGLAATLGALLLARRSRPAAPSAPPPPRSTHDSPGARCPSAGPTR